MITASSVALVIQSAILLVLLGVILFWLWPTVRLDCFRQAMFAIRDDLFDYASSGKIAFSHPAYGLLRQSMNGFIRYGHQVTFYQFVMTSFAWKLLEGQESFKWRKKWEAALGSLDEHTRKDLVAFHGRAAMCVVQRIVLGSPVLILLVMISAIAILFHAGWKSLGELMTDALSVTASKVIDQSILDEEAARAAA